MRFYKLARYDIRNGIGRKAYLYLLTFVLCMIFVCEFGLRVISHGKDFYGEGDPCTVTNILFYLFQGKEPFSPEVGNAFVFPVVWLLIFLLAAYITLDYPYHNLTGHGIQVLLRVRSRNFWWFSKCIWVFFSTLAYFFVWYLGSWAASVIFGMDISFRYSEYMNVELLHMELETLRPGQTAVLVVVLPIMTALAVNFIQLCLGLFFDRIYCFMMSAVLLFASTYFQSPAAIGNFAMVKRSILCQEDGVSAAQGITVNGILILLSIVIGFWRIKKYDIIKKTLQ